MGHQARPGPTGLLQGQLDPDIVTALAVVEHGHGPGELGSLRIVGWMIVAAVVGELLHAASQVVVVVIPHTRVS